MDGLQSFLARILPRTWMASLEAGSRAWHTRCSSCGHESNVWDMGGIRWKAAGMPLSQMHCLGCGKTTLHRIFRPGSPAAGTWVADVEAESRTWHTQCPKCQHESNVWEMGGIRWKAAGNNSRRLMRSPDCDKLAMHRVFRTPPSP
jgi:ribosomal protein S27E